MHLDEHHNFFDIAYHGLPLDRRAEFSKKLEKHIFKKGQFIYRIGEKADRIYFIKSGLAKELVYSDKGEPKFTWYCAIGEPIGLMSMFTTQIRWVDIVAEETCEVLSFDRKDFINFVYTSPTALEALLEQVALIVKESEQIRRDITNLSVIKRLCKNLLWHYKRHYNTEFMLPKLTHLSDYLVVSPQELSRKLQSLEENGYIRRKGRLVLKVNTERIEKEILGSDI